MTFDDSCLGVRGPLRREGPCLSHIRRKCIPVSLDVFRGRWSGKILPAEVISRPPAEGDENSRTSHWIGTSDSAAILISFHYSIGLIASDGRPRARPSIRCSGLPARPYGLAVGANNGYISFRDHRNGTSGRPEQAEPIQFPCMHPRDRAGRNQSPEATGSSMFVFS